MSKKQNLLSVSVFILVLYGAFTSNSVCAADTHKASQHSVGSFFNDSHFNLLFRNYSEAFNEPAGVHNYAWIQGLTANLESGYTPGTIGFGVDASLYAAVKLSNSPQAGNLAYIDNQGVSASDRAGWAFPGIYDIKASISKTVIKYGLHNVGDSNPFMKPHDDRTLSPSFFGGTVVSNEFNNVMLEAGTFTKTSGRGRSNLSDLTSSYGGTTISRLTYGGGVWQYSPSGLIDLYVNRAENVWDQYYASIQQSIGDESSVKWTGFANLYSTHNSGRALQGVIDNNAYSASLTAQHGAHQLMVGYQEILGDQFFDYVNETAGILLANSQDVDYNAPHEKSLQLQYTFLGEHAGLPGLKATVWAVTGWGANGSVGAARDPSKSSKYWKNGQPMGGRHYEVGFSPSYTIQGGRFKNTDITFIAMLHKAEGNYSDNSNRDYRIVVNVPVNVF
jgi:outer membrane porin, OprD family